MGVELNNFGRELYYDASGPFSDVRGEDSRNLINDGNDIVKHSLKSKILERREKLGLDNICVDFTPKKSYPMTEEEKEKDRKRKQSNKKSAQKCRQKQKEEYESNKKIFEQVKKEHEDLLDKVKETEDQKNKVLFSLRKILPETYIDEALRQISHSENQSTIKCSPVGSQHSDQYEPFDDLQKQSLEAVNSLVSNGFTEESALNYNERFDVGEMFFASLASVSEDINRSEESLGVGNEVTLQFTDSSFISDVDTVAHASISEQPHSFSSKLTLLDGSTIFS